MINKKTPHTLGAETTSKTELQSAKRLPDKNKKTNDILVWYVTLEDVGTRNSVQMKVQGRSFDLMSGERYRTLLLTGSRILENVKVNLN